MTTFIKLVFLLLDEIAVIALVFIILWWLGIKPPLGVIIAVALILLAVMSVFYVIIWRLLKRKPITGKEEMIGLEGKVISPLTQDGIIQVRGELWKATSIDASGIAKEEKVVVVSVEGLKLVVKRKKDT